MLLKQSFSFSLNADRAPQLKASVRPLWVYMKPLAELISGRGFDKFQPGLTSRFKAYKFAYRLTYCEPTGDTAMRLDFESTLHLGRVTAWESGACDLEVLEISTGSVVFTEHHQLNSEDEFHNILPRLVLFMRDATGWPKPPA